MFQNLANYLLGSVTSTQPVQGATAEGVENSSIRLTAVEHDDDWVLVDHEKDRDSEGNSDTSSVESLDLSELDDRVDSNLPLPAVLTRTSSTSSLHYVSNMEESWFITPPPCFTSAGPIHMETSPLENLLIEHPSMSVYQHTHRRYGNFVVPLRSASPSSHEDELEVEEVEHERGEQIAVVRRAPRCNRLQVLQQVEMQKSKCRQAQKAQKKQACQGITRGCLSHHNKAREVNSRNRRQRRKERSQGATRSYANNNRKC